MPTNLQERNLSVYVWVAHLPCILLIITPYIAVGTSLGGLVYVSDVLVILSIVLLGYVWLVPKSSRLRVRLLVTVCFVLSLPLHVLIANITGEQCLTAVSLNYLYWWIFINPEGLWSILSSYF